MLALCVFTALAACSSQGQSASSQKREPPLDGDSSKHSSSHDASTDDDEMDGGAHDDHSRVNTRKTDVDATIDGDDAGDSKPPMKQDENAGDHGASTGDSHDKNTDSKPASSTSKTDPPKQKVDDACTRARLQEKAETYLKSMASDDTTQLQLHASFRYTENGDQVQLGAGAWLRRGESEFSRHVLDETACSSLTEAVMNSVTGRFEFAVRLRYVDGKLLEAEAQVVPELIAATDLDSVIPMGADPFVAEVPQDKRMSRDDLFAFAHRYFDSVTDASMLPPSAANCRRRQNGLPLGNGTCTEAPGTIRFEQQRFDLADEPNGIVSATVLYNDHIGVYLLKMSDHMLQSVEVIGGATNQATGW